MMGLMRCSLFKNHGKRRKSWQKRKKVANTRPNFTEKEVNVDDDGTRRDSLSVHVDDAEEVKENEGRRDILQRDISNVVIKGLKPLNETRWKSYADELVTVWGAPADMIPKYAFDGADPFGWIGDPREAVCEYCSRVGSFTQIDGIVCCSYCYYLPSW